MAVKLEKLSASKLYKRVAALTHERDELQRKHDDLVIKSATVISELQGKVDALAAENSGLSSAAECLLHEASEVYRAYNKTQLPDGDLVDEQSLQEVYEAINATPATDAILAEVGAKAVEACANALLSNDDISCEHEYPMMLEFAEKLRKEAGL